VQPGKGAGKGAQGKGSQANQENPPPLGRMQGDSAADSFSVRPAG
jgi:hypothetical protein